MTFRSSKPNPTHSTAQCANKKNLRPTRPDP